MNNKMIKEEKEMEIDLLSLFFFLLDKWKILLLGVVIGAVAAAGITFLQTPMYQSTSTLYVLSKSTSITSVADLQLGSELTSDFTEIATSKPVIDTAIETLKVAFWILFVLAYLVPGFLISYNLWMYCRVSATLPQVSRI